MRKTPTIRTETNPIMSYIDTLPLEIHDTLITLRYVTISLR
jgi:hypothetical protein